MPVAMSVSASSVSVPVSYTHLDLITEGMLSDPLSGKLARNIEEDEVVLYGVGK